MHTALSFSFAKAPVQTSSAKTTLQPGWRLAIAGGVAGMITNTILHPLDTVKTVRQADPKHFPGVYTAILGIIQKRGPFALYAGIVPALFGSALSSALYFGSYEFMKRRVAAAIPTAFENRNTRIPLTAFSAASGNLASSVLFVPKEVVKQRMQSGVDSGRFFGAVRGVVRSSGMAGFYRGYKATLLRNIPSTMLRFAIYEEAKVVISRVKAARGHERSPLSSSEILLAGSVSGSISSALTTPMDVLKTRFATGRIKPGTSIMVAFRDIVRREGARGLFVGIRPRVVWSALYAAIGFTSYEVCKAWVMKQPLPDVELKAQRGGKKTSVQKP